MTRLDKAKARLKARPRDYMYTEAKYLLGQSGFIESDKGRTSGLRVKFYRPTDGKSILMHKPHPLDVMSIGNIKDLAEYLERIGEL